MASHESGGSPSDMTTPPDGSSTAADTTSTISSSYAGTAPAASTPECPYRTSTLSEYECARYLDCPEHTLARPADDNVTAGAADTDTDADINPASDTDAPRETEAGTSNSTGQGASGADPKPALDTDAPRETEASTSTSTSTSTGQGVSNADTNPTLDMDAPDTDAPPETEASNDTGPAAAAEVVDGQSQEAQVNNVAPSEPLAGPQPESISAASSLPSSSSSQSSRPVPVPVPVPAPASLIDNEAVHRAAYQAALASRQRTPPEFTLPSWQPDSEVTQCPICGTAFGFFNRKHHCRKCGRVVCSDCSPHRITIPHAYIVRAPGEITNAQRSADGLGMAIGGGLRVRLCNPCVPDPNTTPPQSRLQPSLNASFSSRFANLPIRPGHLRSHSSASESVYVDRSRTNRERLTDDHYPSESPSDSWSQDATARSRSATVNNTHMLQATVPRTSAFLGNLGGGDQRWDQSSSHMRRHMPVHNPNGPRPSPPQNLAPFRAQGPQDFRRLYNDSVAGSSSASPPGRSFYGFQVNNLRSSGSSSRQANNRPLPRPPQIPEEDECPVCHHELPARTLPDFETLREQHITSCIAAHSTYSPLPAIRGQPPGVHGTPPPRVMRRTGMFPYVATEKDCAKGDECTICLDEYTPGVKLARLECLCRFHHECIMGWFERHPGRCPVHQHDQFGY